VWSRLTQARKLLRQRLSRRGVCLSVLLGAAGLVEGKTPVPAALVATTVQAASLCVAGQATTAGANSPGGAAVAEGVSKTMFLSKLRTVTALCLFMAGVLVAGGGLIMKGRAAAPPPAPQHQEALKQGAKPQEQPVQGKVQTARPQVALQERGDTIA